MTRGDREVNRPAPGAGVARRQRYQIRARGRLGQTVRSAFPACGPGGDGSIDVVYVAHAPGVDMLSPDALVQVEASFSEIEKKLRSSAAAQLDGRGVAWEFQRQASHRIVGSVAAVGG